MLLKFFEIGRTKIGLFIYINVHTKSALKIDKKKLRSFCSNHKKKLTSIVYDLTTFGPFDN